MSRGVLTDRTKEIALNYLGRELYDYELRLYPYVLFQIMDNMPLEKRKLRIEETDILKTWVEEKRIKFENGIFSEFKVTPDFYDAICAILKEGYATDMIGGIDE